MIGNEFTMLRVTGAPMNSLHVLGMRIGASVSWNVPLPEVFTPGTLYFQDFHTDPNGLFVGSDRLELPITRGTGRPRAKPAHARFRDQPHAAAGRAARAALAGGVADRLPSA
ncbi:MAG: hypothetical protein KDE27_05840 [Planctomycetes bacterium]|nr:hypothetical protein [Planctomycetota bacterium]